jgi:3-phenylpropionate/cinnamic acid dioxygenase small subunit
MATQTFGDKVTKRGAAEPDAGTADLYVQVQQFYYHEAQLLDTYQFSAWLALLDNELSYRMPVRVTRRRAEGLGFDANMAHFDDDRASMGQRVTRLEDSTSAWAEDPPSRCRRFVTNLRIQRIEEDRLTCSTYLLVLRSRWDDPDYEFISAERSDELRITDDGFRISKREIHVDQANLGTVNLAVFL